jgi:uncharacterized protein (DUF2141 family)
MISTIVGVAATMYFIFGFGTTFAARIAGLVLLVASPFTVQAADTSIENGLRAAHSDLRVSVSGFRDDKGTLRYCVAPRGAAFPNCEGRGVLTGSTTINDKTASFVLYNLLHGDYAIAVFHDENQNNRLDTVIGIPREGYGFSGNPGSKLGAPSFDEAVISLFQSANTNIRMRYIL